MLPVLMIGLLFCNNGYIFVGSSFMLGGNYYMDPVNREESNPNVWLKS